MAEGPTTMNGPLHTDDASLGDRRITAFFATRAEADATRDALLSEGIPADRVAIEPATTQAADLAPAEDTLIGRVREAILPEDSERATRTAVKHGEVMLMVTPDDASVDRIVDVIEAGRPSHFDAGLERWRNSAPS